MRWCIGVSVEGRGWGVEGRVNWYDPSRYVPVNTVCKHVQEHTYH